LAAEPARFTKAIAAPGFRLFTVGSCDYAPGRIIPPSRILVLTNVDQEKGVRELLKDIPAGNIIAEPSKRDNRRSRRARRSLGRRAQSQPPRWSFCRPTMSLKRPRHFKRSFAMRSKRQKKRAHLSRSDRPASADPGFGYIEMGESISGKPGLFRVVRFREKPNVDLAESFIRKGNFRWNAGMFVWTVRRF